MPVTAVQVRKKVRARAPAATREHGRARILEAALEEFSTVGFDGTSLRQIADRADTQHQLIVYHFKTKEALWRAVVTTLIADAQARYVERVRDLDMLGPTTVLRMMVRDFVLFTAERPQFHRIMTFEGRHETERLRWLLDEFVRPVVQMSKRVIRAAQKAGAARPGDPGRLHYATIGLVTTSFVFATEYRLMTKLEPFDRREIENIVDLACDFLGVGKAV